jgi:DnaJ like chaperone protein
VAAHSIPFALFITTLVLMIGFGIYFVVINTHFGFFTETEKTVIKIFLYYAANSENRFDKTIEILHEIFDGYSVKKLNLLIQIEKNKKFSIEKLGRKLVGQSHRLKYLILYQFFKISSADRKISSADEKLIHEVSNHLKVHYNVYQRIKLKFITDEKDHNFLQNTIFTPEFQIAWAFRVLELNPDSDLKTVKKKFRKLAMQNHPDKIINQNSGIMKISEEKFMEIHEAYQILKKYLK